MGIFPMRKFESLSPKKASCHMVALPKPQLIWSLEYAECVCDHTTGSEAYSFTTDGYRIVNVHTHLDACRTCIARKGGQEQTNLHKSLLDRRDRNTAPHPAPPRDRTTDLKINGSRIAVRG